jgi:hypothetical protein
MATIKAKASKTPIIVQKKAPTYVGATWQDTSTNKSANYIINGSKITCINKTSSPTKTYAQPAAKKEQVKEKAVEKYQKAVKAKKPVYSDSEEEEAVKAKKPIYSDSEEEEEEGPPPEVNKYAMKKYAVPTQGITKKVSKKTKETLIENFSDSNETVAQKNTKKVSGEYIKVTNGDSITQIADFLGSNKPVAKKAYKGTPNLSTMKQAASVYENIFDGYVNKKPAVSKQKHSPPDTESAIKNDKESLSYEEYTILPKNIKSSYNQCEMCAKFNISSIISSWIGLNCCHHCLFKFNYEIELRPLVDGINSHPLIVDYILKYAPSHVQCDGQCFLCDHNNGITIQNIKHPEKLNKKDSVLTSGSIKNNKILIFI